MYVIACIMVCVKIIVKNSLSWRQSKLPNLLKINGLVLLDARYVNRQVYWIIFVYSRHPPDLFTSAARYQKPRLRSVLPVRRRLGIALLP